MTDLVQSFVAKDSVRLRLMTVTSNDYARYHRDLPTPDNCHLSHLLLTLFLDVSSSDNSFSRGRGWKECFPSLFTSYLTYFYSISAGDEMPLLLQENLTDDEILITA